MRVSFVFWFLFDISGISILTFLITRPSAPKIPEGEKVDFDVSWITTWNHEWKCRSWIFCLMSGAMAEEMMMHLSITSTSVSHCDRTSRRNAKTKTWLSCSPWSMLTLSAGRRRRKSSLRSKNELWDFSHHKIQLSLVYFPFTYSKFWGQILHVSQNWSPKMFRF